jgi:hypothetical protein
MWHHQYHPLKTEDFEELGIEIMKFQQCQSRRQLNRKFESFFGAWPFYCAMILRWKNALRRTSRLLEKAPTARVNPARHLLMGLHFLKAYNTEERSAVTFGCDGKTIQQWAWFIILSISARLLETKFVSLDGRRGCFYHHCACLTTAHLRCSGFFRF